MGIKMVFDERVPAYRPGNDEANLWMLRNAENYLNEELKARGYLYLNQVYEILEMAWDSRQVNKLFVSEEGVRFAFKNVRKKGSGYEFVFCVVTK